MLIIIRLSLFSILLPFLNYSQDNCSEILKWGIFDLTTVDSEDDFSTQFADWFSNSNFKQSSSAVEAGISVVGVGFDAGTENSNTSKEEFLRKINTNSEQRKKYQTYFKTANPNIINAWAGCVQPKNGLIVSAIRIPGTTYIKLKIKVGRRSDRDRLDTLRIREIDVPDYLKPRKQLGNTKLSEINSNEFYFELSKGSEYSSVFFNITTNFSDYAASFDLIGLKMVESDLTINRDNLLDVLNQCKDLNKVKEIKLIRDYFSKLASEFKERNPGQMDFCYENFVKNFDQLIYYSNQYREEVRRNGENTTADNYKLQANQLLYQQIAIINDARQGYSNCNY